VSRTSHPDLSGAPPDPARWIPLALFPLLALLPPETRGESMAASAALVALLALRAWNHGERRTERILLVVAAALALPAAWAALAPGAAVWPSALALVAGGAGLSVAALPRGERFGERVGQVLALTGGLVSVHALYQRLWGFERLAARVAADPALPDRDAMLARLEQGRAFAAFATPAALGGFLALSTPLTLALLLRARGARRPLWGALLLLQLAGMLCAASATAIAALLGAVALAGLVWKIRGRLVGIVLLLVLALLASVIALRGAELIRSNHPNSPWRLRAGNFTAAWSMARDHAWIGVGPGGFAESYPAYRRPGDNETRHAHNLPLELAAELGIPAGSLAGLLFFAVFLGPLLRARRDADPWARAVAVGLAAFALQNLADFTALMPSLLWTAALLRGGAAPADGAVERSRPVSGLRGLAGVSLVVVVLATLIAAAQGISDLSRHLAREAVRRDDAAAAERLAARAVAWAPWDPDAALFRARNLAASRWDHPGGPGDEAGEAADRAVRLSPVRPAAREHRARVRLARGDYPGAYGDLLLASRLYPHNAEYQRSLQNLRVSVEAAIARAGGAP
jgi:O-antigen ligase